MKAVIHVDLTVAQTKNILEDACGRLQAAGPINGHQFEIETPDGPVTERCVMVKGK